MYSHDQNRTLGVHFSFFINSTLWIYSLTDSFAFPHVAILQLLLTDIVRSVPLDRAPGRIINRLTRVSKALYHHAADTEKNLC